MLAHMRIRIIGGVVEINLNLKVFRP